MKTFRSRPRFVAKPTARVQSMANKYGTLEIPKQESGEPPLLEFNSTLTTPGDGTLDNVTYATDWTVVRNLAAVYYDGINIKTALANYARIEATGVVVEIESTNNRTYSNSTTNYIFQNGGLAVDPVLTGSYASSPFNDYQAFRVQFDLQGGTTSGDFSEMQFNTVSATDTGDKTTSFYIKSNDANDYTLRMTYPDLTTTNIVAGQTWQRIEMTSVGFSDTLSINRLRAAGNISDDVSDILMCCVQSEIGSSATSYIHNASSTENTRPADVITITPPVGTASIIEWINNVEQSEITIIPGTFTMKDGTTKVIMR